MSELARRRAIGRFAVVGMVAALAVIGCEHHRNATTPAPQATAVPQPTGDTTAVVEPNTESTSLYFDATGDTIRLSANAEPRLPELSRALVPTTIASTEEHADVEGPHGAAVHLQIATASAIDQTALDSVAGRNVWIGGIMLEPTHVSLTLSPNVSAAQVAAAMLDHCTEGAPNDLHVSSAERRIDSGSERLRFQIEAAEAASSLLAWATDRGIPIHTAPPEQAASPSGTQWVCAVYDLRPRAVVLECSRGRTAR